MFRVIAVGVREPEREMYERIHTEMSGCTIDLVEMGKDIQDPVLYEKGYDAVVDGDNTTVLSDPYFAMLEEYGIRVFIIKMTGYNHIDLDAAKRHGVMVANVEAYSPNAISELAVGMALALNRDLPAVRSRFDEGNYTASAGFPKEIRDSRAGILGTGHIGMVTARMMKALGAEVYGYDRFPKEENEEILTYVSLEELFRICDIILIHAAYIPGQNEHLIDNGLLSLAKKDLILINAARGELVDPAAVAEALRTDRIRAFGADVLENEKEIFGRKDPEIKQDALRTLLAMKDRVLITPHIGANTVRARENQIRIALEEAQSLYENGKAPYRIV